MLSRRTRDTVLTGLIFGGLSAGSAMAQESVGFVTHAYGNPFIQQIIDGAMAAGEDLGVTITVAGEPGGSPEGQLRLVQDFANSGIEAVVTSVPGESMVLALNELIGMGITMAQFNILGAAVKAPYVGERSVESGRILGGMIIEELGGADATGTVVIGICFPGFPVLENRALGVQEALAAAPGLTVLGPFDVKVSESENFGRWEQLYAANPDVKAMIGLCAPDVTSLGKLNEANGNTFIAGGYDLTESNLTAIGDGHAFVTIGQSAFVQGYLPVVLVVNALRSDTALTSGFYDAGIQIVTADSVDMGNGLPAISFAEAVALAGDPAATRAYYAPWVATVAAGGLMSEPVEAESQ